MIPVRWQSGGGGGASGGNTGGPQGGGRGFFQNFVDNLRKGLERNREMQEGLKGFQEEREKMKQSYFMQAAKENMTNAKVSCEDLAILIGRKLDLGNYETRTTPKLLMYV